MIHPIARLPDRWVDDARSEGAHVDFTLKSPWQLFADFEGDEIFGFVGLLLTGSKRCTIRGWYVFPKHRGRGVGTGLLSHALDWAESNGYETVEIRTAHQVNHFGFEWTGYERKGGNRERQYRLNF